jgi:hypothetical protein
MRTLWIIIGVLLLATTRVVLGAQGHTFHVDAAVNRTPLAPGDQVLFRRGQRWRGQLVPQSGDASGVTLYGAFGEGNKPVLLGSVAADRTEDWQPAGEGIWATVPLHFEPFGVYPLPPSGATASARIPTVAT